ncbi:MAG: hypothetical protein AAFR52_09580 [Pseudomonadota bacterium]
MLASPLERRWAFRLAEYGSLRQEIVAQQNARLQTEQIGLALLAGLYAWLFTQSSTPGLPAALVVAAWTLPPLVALAVRQRIVAIGQGIKRAGAYLSWLQAEIAAPGGARPDPADGPMGWELALAFFRRRRDEPQVPAAADTDTDFGVTVTGRRDKVAHVLGDGLPRPSDEAGRAWGLIVVVSCVASLVGGTIALQH